MTLLRFIKMLAVRVRLNLLTIPKDSWLLVRAANVDEAAKFAKQIDRTFMAGAPWQGIIVCNDQISVGTIRNAPQELRRRLLQALLEAEGE
jgi:hypothetical protein